jgi:hypothetical protein
MISNSISVKISGQIIANQIRLQRARHKGSFLLLEGESDCKLFRRFVDDLACVLVNCLGRDRLLDATRILNDDGFSGFVAIADRDFSDRLGVDIALQNVMFPDNNDLEIDIIMSDALSIFLHEFGSKPKLAQHGDPPADGVRQTIFRAAAGVGALRFLSQQKGWGLDFSGELIKFASRAVLDIDVEATARRVIARSRMLRILSVTQVTDEVTALILGEERPERLCCGHDCVRILGRGTARVFGNNKIFDDDGAVDNLERVMRLAYKFADFKLTKTYENLLGWQAATGYVLFSKSAETRTVKGSLNDEAVGDGRLEASSLPQLTPTKS